MDERLVNYQVRYWTSRQQTTNAGFSPHAERNVIASYLSACGAGGYMTTLESCEAVKHVVSLTLPSMKLLWLQHLL